MTDVSPELDAWMRRNRARRAKSLLERKIKAARRARRASILVPVTLAESLLAIAERQAAE